MRSSLEKRAYFDVPKKNVNLDSIILAPRFSTSLKFVQPQRKIRIDVRVAFCFGVNISRSVFFRGETKSFWILFCQTEVLYIESNSQKNLCFEQN